MIGTLNEMATAIAISKFPKNRFKRQVLSGVSLSYFAVTNPFTVSDRPVQVLAVINKIVY